MLSPKRFSDDLFEQSSMSFGEHLEELRLALVKACLWLALGTSIGLLFSERVVRFVAEPFKAELKNFYLSEVSQRYEAVNGHAPPPEFVQWMVRHGAIPKRIFVLEPADTSAEPRPLERRTAATGVDDRWWSELADDPLPRLKQQVQMEPIPAQLKSFELLEGFMVYFKASLLVGAILAFPGMFWHLWAFLAAGLYPHERRSVYLFFPLSMLLFLSGVGLAFFVIIKFVIRALLAYNSGLDIDIEPRLRDYVSFALWLPLGFGIAFQLPLIMLGLHRFGVLPVETFTQQWRLALLVIAFCSMVLTPPEVYTMIGMFVPLTLLYFSGILLCKLMPGGDSHGFRQGGLAGL